VLAISESDSLHLPYPDKILTSAYTTLPYLHWTQPIYLWIIRYQELVLT